MKLDLNADGVFQLDLSTEQCRDFDEAVSQIVEEALDEPQGFVFSDEGEVAYLVIRVTKAGA